MRARLLFLVLGWAAAGAAQANRPEITIDPGGVPPAALRAINTSVDAIARLAEDQDGGEAARLRRRAHEATLSALATQGYFVPEVTLTVGEDVAGETWDIAIVPGVRATVDTVALHFEGRIAESDQAARVQALRRNWQLPAGRVFINEDWSQAKSSLLEAVGERDFYLARIAGSRARVDAETGKVALEVTIDSGPQVHLGELATEGLERVPERLIRRYVNYTPGRRYAREDLERWQQDLQTTAFFRGAFVSLVLGEGPPGEENPDGRGDAPGAAAHAGQVPSAPARTGGTTDASAASQATPPLPLSARREVTLPVRVRVSEAPPRRLSVGVGVDDSVGPRVELVYRQNVVLGQPVTMETGVGVDRERQRAYLDFHLPPTEKGERDSVGLLAEHSDIQGLDVTRFAVGATRSRLRLGAGESRVEYETRFGVLAAHDRVRIDGGDVYDLPTLTTTAEWLRRDVDDKYNPRQGNLLAVGGGVGLTLDKQQPFTRATLRAQQWWPVGERDVFTVRGEVGKLWSTTDTLVPDDFGFRTGGARTVRGYRYLSIGRQLEDAVVGADALAVASAEYMHYFDDTFGMGVFVDAGDAAESFGQMRMSVGYGVGARVRTPAGPLFLDLAYGQRERSLRLHFSLGIAF
ncbi:BamA/TamA family outer membrane protein [Orrella sp. JC864]